MPPRPLELFENPDNIRDMLGFAGDYRQSLLDRANLLDGMADAPDTTQFLEETFHLDTARAMAHALLRDLEPSVLVRAYGAQVLIWTALHERETSVFDRQTVELKKRGFNNTLIRNACFLEREHHTQALRVKAVLAHYSFMENWLGGAVDRVDLPAVLQATATEPLSDSTIEDYGLMALGNQPEPGYLDGPAQWSIDPDNVVWLDTPVGFILTCRHEPHALVSVAAHGTDDVMIHQMQGVRPKRRNPQTGKFDKQGSSYGLIPLDWRKTLVTVVGSVAAELEMKSVVIQQGSKNIWTKKRYGQPHAHITVKYAKQAYDQQAKRLGFDPGVDGNWYKPVDQFDEL